MQYVDPLLSIIIPIVRASNQLLINLEIFAAFSAQEGFLEVIVIDQTDRWQDCRAFEKVRKFRVKRMPASEARNVGLRLARGRWVWFFDDDAELINSNSALSNLRIELGKSQCNAYVLNRGYTDLLGVYRSYNPLSTAVSSALFLITEWNVIYRKSSILSIGGFPPIGIGHKHVCQSGEALLLNRIGKSSGWSYLYNEIICVSHPNFYGKSPKGESLIFGYAYGAAYSLNVSIMASCHSAQTRMMKLVAGLAQIPFNLFLRGEKRATPRVTTKGASNFVFMESRARFFGLLDALRSNQPRMKLFR